MIVQKRNAFIDTYRFMMAICIMMFHSYHLDNIVNYPFKVGGQVFVEAFFLLSGYFVTKYVEISKKEHKFDIKSDVIHALTYTWKKYSKFLPYTFVTVFISLIIRHLIINNDFNFVMLLKGVFESLMVIRGDNNVGVLWYMAAMLPLIPIIIIIEKRFPNYIYTIMAAIVVFVWYICFGRFYDCFVPLSYLRAIAGLSLGIITFWFEKQLRKIEDKRLASVLNVLLIVSLLTPVIMCFINLTNERIIILLFIIGFSLCFHPLTFKFPATKFTKFCEKYSFLIYIIHLNIADFIAYLSKKYFTLKVYEQYILYFLMTFVCVFILEALVIIISKTYAKLIKHLGKGRT